MAVWSTVTASNIQESFGRFDAEFYRPENLEAFNQVTTKNFEPIARLATDGYRVVYENTKILPSERVTGNCPIFLQATNISANGLAIDFQGAGYVSESDWHRYPKGRIQPGELLIEVKGQAEKVAIVPQNINARVLVSGSLFKLSVDKSKINPWYVFVYFSTKHGKLLRDRLKTNTLIGFVSKPQLYSIPVFIPDNEVDINKVATLSEKAFSFLKESEAAYTQAQQLLESELGLDKLRFDKPVGYAARFSELELSHRADAQHYQPRFAQLLEHLGKFQTKRIREIRRYNRRGIQPVYVENGTHAVVNSQHLGPKHINYDGLQKTTEHIFNASPEAHIQPDDLLIYTTGAYIGRTNVYLDEAPAFASNHVNILRLSPDIDHAYMAMVFQSIIGQFQTQKHARGSAQAELYPVDIDKFLVPLLPPDKQREIGNLVRESLTKQRESVQLLDQAKSRVEQLIEEAVRR